MKLFPLYLTLLAAGTVSCSPIITERKTPKQPVPAYQPKSEAEAKEVLNEAGKDIVYGETIGQIGASVLFPPYGIYKLGQFAAGACGYELDVTQALPPVPRQALHDAGTAVISAPGRATSWVAGEEYRGKGKLAGKLEKKAEEAKAEREAK
jgi:hypothetical protein